MEVMSFSIQQLAEKVRLSGLKYRLLSDGRHCISEYMLPKMINGVKLSYLCRNKLPRIIFVLMHGDDYVINASSISPGVRR